MESAFSVVKETKKKKKKEIKRTNAGKRNLKEKKKEIILRQFD